MERNVSQSLNDDATPNKVHLCHVVASDVPDFLSKRGGIGAVNTKVYAVKVKGH